MDELQTVLYLVGALAVLLTAVAAAVKLAARQSDKAVEAERKARAALEKELRDDLAAARAGLELERQERQKLEQQQRQDKDRLEAQTTEIGTMRGQIGTLLAEMAALQGQVQTLTDALNREQQDNQSLRHDLVARDETIRQLTADKQALTIRCESYRDALALVRGEAVEEAGPAEDTTGSVAEAQEGSEHG